MAEKFPDARFIFLWRDPKAVMESITRAARTERFFRKRGFANKVLIGTENLKNAYDVLKSRGQLVHAVTYEDLTTNTSECMRQICQFLEIPFESRITSLEGADTSAVCSGPHHMMVRGERVVDQRKATELLSPTLEAKIARYICRWKLRYDGKCPKYPVELAGGTTPPGRLELWYDRLMYQIVICRDKIVALIYALVPMDFARWLRGWARQRVRLKGALAISE
jgi:hypothetical protein